MNNSNYKQTFTITFGDQAENHAGMQKIGKPRKNGFELSDLEDISNWFEEKKCTCQLVDISASLPEENREEAGEAYILIVRDGLSVLANKEEFYQEQEDLEKDKKAKMRGRVVNKHARHNLCFADFSQEPDYEAGKGTIVNFGEVPVLSSVRQKLQDISCVENLVAEGNYYYDLKNCGIGFHGDSERKVVIAVRVGASMSLHYQWYFQGNRIGERLKLNLNNGDIYFMSDKAVGYDWRRRKVYTLRHAAGAEKYLK